MNDKITLKPDQAFSFKKLKAFIEDKQSKIFILKDYVGTRETTLIKLLIDELNKKEYSYLLLASTSRAAKILSNINGYIQLWLAQSINYT